VSDSNDRTLHAAPQLQVQQYSYFIMRVSTLLCTVYVRLLQLSWNHIFHPILLTPWFFHMSFSFQDFVFVKANEYLTVLIKDQEPLRLEIGDVSVLQYSAVQEYVLADRLLLMWHILPLKSLFSSLFSCAYFFLLLNWFINIFLLFIFLHDEKQIKISCPSKLLPEISSRSRKKKRQANCPYRLLIGSIYLLNPEFMKWLWILINT
jgi:DNA replication complex GINS protein SLD5 C-terminus